MSVAVQAPYRPLRGSRLEDFYPPVPAEGPSLSNLDSAFQLQEYISLLVRQNPHDVDTIVTTPEKVKTASTTEEKAEDASEKEGKPDMVVEESSWIYEQLRRLAQDLTHPLITSLQLECTRASCPEMKAGEWLYLCVAHGQEGALEQCCAIDYIIHTLDSATALLNSPRAFPSRLTIPPASVRHFPSLARRLGRIFAHAYFHHREAFEHAEAESSLYARFLALTERFKLVPAEFLVIPSSSQSASSEDTEAPRLPAAMGPPAAGNEAGSSDQNSGRETSEEATSGASSTAAETQPESGSEGDASGRRSESPEKSASPSGLESPRKMGRSRTDTMIFSDAAAFSEELRNASGSGSRGLLATEQRSPARPSGRTLWGENSSARDEPKILRPHEYDDNFVPLDYEKYPPHDEKTESTKAEAVTREEETASGKESEGEGEEKAVGEPESIPVDSTDEAIFSGEESGASHDEAPGDTAEHPEEKEIEEISVQPEEELHQTSESTETSEEEPVSEQAEVALPDDTKVEEQPNQDDASEFVVVDESGDAEEKEDEASHADENEKAPPPEDQEAGAADAEPTSEQDDAATPATDSKSDDGESKESAGAAAEEKKEVVDVPASVEDDVPELVPQ